MRPRVYLETTFVSYLTARPSRDVIVAGHQPCWRSPNRRLTLAEELVKVGALPTKAENDALHIEIAAIHGVPYLLTWNCRHMANATMRAKIEDVCASRGFKAPIICTPEEMMEVKP